MRYQCTKCGYTFRVYPVGVTRRQQSDRLCCLSVLLWNLGLSLGCVVVTVRALGCPLGRTTVYENVCVAGQRARRRMRERLRSGVRVRVLGMDCTHVKVAGKDKVVVQSIDVMAGRTLEVEVLPGEDERTIVRYVSRMAKLTGAEVLVTDDADAFKTAADTVGLKHQVCQQHVVPNTLRLVAEIASDLLGRQDAGTSEKPGDLSSEQAIEDLASLETIILARAPSSQADLEVLQQRYQKAPPPSRGKRADSFYRMRLLTMDLAARPRPGRGGLVEIDTQRHLPRARRPAFPSRDQQCQRAENRAQHQGAVSHHARLQDHLQRPPGTRPHRLPS